MPRRKVFKPKPNHKAVMLGDNRQESFIKSEAKLNTLIEKHKELGNIHKPPTF